MDILLLIASLVLLLGALAVIALLLKQLQTSRANEAAANKKLSAKQSNGDADDEAELEIDTLLNTLYKIFSHVDETIKLQRFSSINRLLYPERLERLLGRILPDFPRLSDEMGKLPYRIMQQIEESKSVREVSIPGYIRGSNDAVLDLANGDADGTEFRIILKADIADEETVAFATPGRGFDQSGFYQFGLFDDVFDRLLKLTKGDKPSVNLIQERRQEPLKALVLSTVARRDFNYTDVGHDRNYYYSMHYAAIELLATNFYSRIHIGSIAHSSYEPVELGCIIEAFIHYARQSDHAKLELVVGGPAYFNYHVGNNAYLDTIEEFIQHALIGVYTPVKTTESKESGLFSEEDVRRFDLQRRIVHV